MVDTWDYPGSTLDHVTDGDTFHAKLNRTVVYASTNFDVGFHATLPSSLAVPVNWVQKFRLNRINAAPSSTLSGQGAAAALSQLLSGVWFDLLSVGPYKYGDEWMAEVTLPDGTNVSDWMVAQQWAAPWNGQGPQPLPPWPRTI